jgi:hypothetical protein
VVVIGSSGTALGEGGGGGAGVVVVASVVGT